MLVNQLKALHKGPIESVDISSGKPLHEIYNFIVAQKPELIITIDCAGFELVTENDTLSLNGIHCRIVNILLHNTDSYRGELKYRQGLSMFTYFSYQDAGDEDKILQLKNRYPHIPNINSFCKYDYKTLNGADDKDNLENLSKWFEEMMRDIRL